jgi:hypothetical protein
VGSRGREDELARVGGWDRRLGGWRDVLVLVVIWDWLFSGQSEVATLWSLNKNNNNNSRLIIFFL